MLGNVVELHATRGCDVEVLAQARRLLLDTIGCAIAGRHAPEVRKFEALLSTTSDGVFLFPGGRRLGVFETAQVFAMAAVWDEACEGHAYAHGRPGVAIIGALLPLAIQRNATLDQLLDALILGYEVGARAGGWVRILPGLHVDGNWPSIGVAAAVGRLIGLTSEEIVQAMNIAACQPGMSLYLPVKTGHTSRNTYLGHSGILGIQSSFASASGVGAPSDALAYIAEHYSAATMVPLPPADQSLLLEGYLKSFAAVRHVHYGASAAANLRGQALTTEGISSIMLQIYEEAMIYCGNRAPETPIQAQFSLTFGVAAMLRYGDIDPSVYEEPKFSDPELRRLEALVILRKDEALTEGKSRGATVILERNGETLKETVGSVLGDAGRPLDNNAVTEKFVRYTSQALGAGEALRFCEQTLDGSPVEVGAWWSSLHV